MTPPSKRVLANRRRFFIWLPLTTVGAFLYLFHVGPHGHMGLFTLGLLMLAFFGMAAICDGRGIDATPFWEEDLK